MKTLPADAENLKKSRESQVESLRTPTAEQREAMWHVRNGADISDPFIAKLLRSVERDFGSLIWIGKPMGQYKGAGHVPYFGAILTAKGKEAIGLPGDFAPHYVD